jgi:hypothetical protein
MVDLKEETEEVYEDEWIKIFLIEKKPKTNVFSVWSKCSGCKLGEIRWYPKWRHYCFIVGDFIFSDRCMLNIGNNVLMANKKHKEKSIW